MQDLSYDLYKGGLSVREIARSLSSTQNSVRVMISRQRRELGIRRITLDISKQSLDRLEERAEAMGLETQDFASELLRESIG
jgi:predicted transcriptional regulator